MKWESLSTLFDEHRARKAAYTGILLPGAYIDLQGTLMSVDRNPGEDFVPLSGGFPQYNRFVNWFGHHADQYSLERVHVISKSMGNYWGHLRELGYISDKFGTHAKGALSQQLTKENALLEFLVDDMPEHKALTVIHPNELTRLLKAAGIAP